VWSQKGLRHRSPFAFRLVIVMDYGLAAITVSIFLLDHGLAVMWLPLLDHGWYDRGHGRGIDHAARQPLRQRRPDRREHQLRPPTRGVAIAPIMAAANKNFLIFHPPV